MRRLNNKALRALFALMLLTLAAQAFAQAPAVSPSADTYKPTASPDRIVLTWSDDPATTQSVSWRTDTSVDKAVAQIAVATPGPSVESQARTVIATTSALATKLWSANYHTVRFANLTPGTVYAYRVGDSTRWSEWFQFRTADSKPEPFSFIYFGDVQYGMLSVWSRIIRDSFRTAPDARFMAFGGDLVTDGTDDSLWGELFAAGGWLYATVPTIPVPGNHEYHDGDIDRAGLTKHWAAQFTLPANGPDGLKGDAYYFDYQGVRVVSLDSMSYLLKEQADWLDKTLTNNPNRWSVVIFHHPFFSLAKGRDNADVRNAWKPIVDKHKVDLVLNGHDHSYGRSALTDSTVYVTSTSGAKMYKLDKVDWPKRKAQDTQFYVVVSIDGDKLAFRARTATGELYDSFDLIKQPGKPNLLVETR